MGVQTSVSTAPARGIEGQLAEPGAPTYRVSAVIEATANAALPGKLFVRGTADGQAKTITNAGTITPANILGIAMYEDAREPSDFTDKRPVTLVRQGVIYVAVSENVTDGAPAVYGNTTGNLDEWGVTVDADHVPVPGARWAQTVSSGGIARLEVDFGQADVGTLAPAATFSYTSNDFAVPASTPSGTVFDVATTAANSTISLPAAAPDGTILYFRADGTKNGHTITYRDVTTAISAATTASKVHLAIAVCLGNAWAITLTVSP